MFLSQEKRKSCFGAKPAIKAFTAIKTTMYLGVTNAAIIPHLCGKSVIALRYIQNKKRIAKK